MRGVHTTCQRECVRIFRAGECGNAHFSVSGAVGAEVCGVPREATVLATLAEAEVREKRCDARGITLTGEICCHILFCKDGEVGAAGTSVPFAVRMDGGYEALSVQASVPICRVAWQGDELLVDAELAVALRASHTVELTRVSGVEMGARVENTHADMEICYPAREETLWSVAKRYAISPDALALANGIAAGAEDFPAEMRYLLIPKGSA